MKFVRLFVARDRSVRCVETFFSILGIKNRDWREIVARETAGVAMHFRDFITLVVF